ncbi:MAG TPA: hypothetical protein PLM79_16915 [Syntrophobacteraceae bacterium]|nr:hypothetical protein [Syntrophobacteraceae bacterium]
MTTKAYDRFLAAFRALVDSEGWGVQARLARSVGKTARHINGIYKGKMGASLDLQENIAAFFGMSYEDILARGREILASQSRPARRDEKPVPFQDKLDAVGRNNKLAARLIADEAARAVGYPNFMAAIIDSVGIYPPGWKEYLADEISAYDFWEETKQHVLNQVGKLKE